MSKSKILLLDIETAPAISYIWDLYQEITNYDFIIRDGYVLCWVAKWADENKYMSASLIDDPKAFKKDPTNDKAISQGLWNLIDEAKVIIGHNCLNFDLKKMNTRFYVHDLGKPSPSQVIDTLSIARANFAFMSNKLGDLSKIKGERKLPTGGFDLWKRCMEPVIDKEAWKHMTVYCKKDVELLQARYDEFRAWHPKHPNCYIEMPGVCPRCGGNQMIKKGFYYTGAGKYQRFLCKTPTCGGTMHDKVNLLTKEQRASALVSD